MSRARSGKRMQLAAPAFLDDTDMRNYGVTSARRLYGALLMAASFSSTGCSFIFVRPAPNDGRIVRHNRAARCTSSALDGTFAALQLARTALAASADDSVYTDPKQPLSRGADIALGVGFTALFLSSAIYGGVKTSECSRIKQSIDDSPKEESPRPATEWGAATEWGPTTRGYLPQPAAAAAAAPPAVQEAPSPTPRAAPSNGGGGELEDAPSESEAPVPPPAP